MTTLNTLLGDLNNIQREYQEKRLNVVTTVKDLNGDTCDGHKRVTVMKYYTVKPKEYYTERHYEEHNGGTYRMTTVTIKPRRFYEESKLRVFIKYLNKIAGRTICDDEMRLLLRHITNGRQYELTCLINETAELNGTTMWKDIK